MDTFRELKMMCSLKKKQAFLDVFGRISDLFLRVLESKFAWLFLSMSLVLYVSIGLVYLRTWSTADYWEHLAVIGAFAENLSSPDNPFTGTGNLTHLFTSYHLFWGLIARLTGIHPLHLTPVIGLSNILMFLIACRVVSRRFLNDSKYALIVCLILLLAWVKPWSWSGCYNFGMLPTTIIYPYWFAFPLALIIVSKFADSSSRGLGLMVLLGVGAALTFTMHPMSGSFLFASMGLIALFEGDIKASVRLAMLGTIVAAACLALLWPYFPILGAIQASSKYKDIGFESNYYQWYEEMHLRALPCLLSLPAIWATIKSRKPDFLVIALIAFSVIYVTNFVTARSAVGGRLVIYIIFFTQILIVRSLIIWRKTWFGTVITMLVVLLIVAAGFTQIRESINRIVPVESYSSQLINSDRLDTGTNFEMHTSFQMMFEHLTPNNIILAREIESWVIPSLLGCKVVTVAHANPFMEDFKARKSVVKSFFESQMSRVEMAKFIDSYQITHVLISKNDHLRLNELLSGYEVLWSGCDYDLLLLAGI